MWLMVSTAIPAATSPARWRRRRPGGNFQCGSFLPVIKPGLFLRWNDAWCRTIWGVAQHEPVREAPDMEYIAVLQAAGSRQLFVVHPRPGHGIFIGKNIVALHFLQPGMDRRDRWVFQNTRGMQRVRAKEYFRSVNRDGRCSNRLAVVFQTDKKGFCRFGQTISQQEGAAVFP